MSYPFDPVFRQQSTDYTQQTYPPYTERPAPSRPAESIREERYQSSSLKSISPDHSTFTSNQIQKIFAGVWNRITAFFSWLFCMHNHLRELEDFARLSPKVAARLFREDPIKHARLLIEALKNDGSLTVRILKKNDTNLRAIHAEIKKLVIDEIVQKLPKEWPRDMDYSLLAERATIKLNGMSAYERFEAYFGDKADEMLHLIVEETASLFSSPSRIASTIVMGKNIWKEMVDLQSVVQEASKYVKKQAYEAFQSL